MTATKPTTIKGVQAELARVLNETLGVNVEATARRDGFWTISGPDGDARKASTYLVANCGFRLEDGLESIVHDEELGETFIYMTNPAR